jgi:DNA-binding NarL/FixJ family response regulator
MRILLAEDHQPARFALCTLLEQQPDWHIVGEATSTEGLVTLVRSSPADIVLLSWKIAALNPDTLIPWLQKENPNLSIIILSGRPEDRGEALSAGADMFVCKADAPDKLLEAIYTLMES